MLHMGRFANPWNTHILKGIQEIHFFELLQFEY